MENVVIITGGNKGLGLGLSQEYAENGHKVISISRSAIENMHIHKQYQCDLSKTASIEIVLQKIFSELNKEDIKTITFINNAGELGTIKLIENLSSSEIENTLQLNLIAPLILSSLFIKSTKDWAAKKKIINISSGAATSPYASWSTYCSSKAGLDMMTKVIHEEQKQLENGVEIISIYPGIVDTDMQLKIRNTSEKDFKSVHKFKDLYKKGELYSPKQVAEKIFYLDTINPVNSGSIVDVRNT